MLDSQISALWLAIVLGPEIPEKNFGEKMLFSAGK
jgi:hypothetical protein